MGICMRIDCWRDIMFKKLIRRFETIEILAYIIQNKLARYFNFSGSSSSKLLNADMVHAEKLFREYDRLLGKDINWFKGKRILEIGTGKNFLIPFKFVNYGAKEVVTIDRFDCIKGNYSGMYQEKGKGEIKHIITPLEEADKVVEGKFDLIISNAVLEHTLDLDKCFSVMNELLKPGGLMVHIVDLRNHNRFNGHPLKFLTFSDRLWHLMSSNLGSPNRERFSDYQYYLNKYNFKRICLEKKEFEQSEEYIMSIRHKLDSWPHVDDSLMVESFRGVWKKIVKRRKKGVRFKW